MPVAPSEEASNLEIAHLNENNVAALLVQQKENASIQQHLSTSLSAQLQSIQAQQSKLAFIKTELSKLDQQLSDSIDVLRNQIEDVGRQCLTLQADFTIKERDYLDARKALAKAKQRKGSVHHHSAPPKHTRTHTASHSFWLAAHPCACVRVPCAVSER